jgi:hypothetical protein
MEYKVGWPAWKGFETASNRTRLIDKQTLDEEVQEINQGQQDFYLYL